MKWETVPFGDLFSEKTRNGVYKSADFHGSGVKIVNMGELFAAGKIGPQRMERVELSESERHVSLLRENDLLFARRSLVESGAGKVSIVHGLTEETTFESSIIRVRLNTELCNPLFYYYWLSSFPGRAVILPLITGLNVKGIRGSELTGIKVSYPPIKIQNTISNILSAYDDLIENNQKQIKLLEEAAQRLYKEWFIDLRFPGYETTPVHDGVPEGWKRYPFSQKVSVMSGGTPKTEVKENYGGSIPFYSPKDHNGSFFVFQTATTITDAGLANCNSPLYPENTIIITARGTVGKTVILAVPMAMNQSCYALKCDELNLPYYLFFALNAEVQKLRTMSNGGVFDTIIVKTFDNIEITFPANNLAASFEKTVSPMMEQIKAKMLENMTLTEARDRLLPKLMSGEIEV